MPISRILSRKKRKLAEITTHCHSFSLAVIRCYSLYRPLYYSVSLVVPLFFTRCHTLSLDVSLVCFFINDLKLGNILSQFKSIFRKEWQKSNTYLVFILHTVEILQFSFKKLLDLDLKNTRTSLLHSAWSYDILDLAWKVFGLPYWS